MAWIPTAFEETTYDPSYEIAYVEHVDGTFQAMQGEPLSAWRKQISGTASRA